MGRSPQSNEAAGLESGSDHGRLAQGIHLKRAGEAAQFYRSLGSAGRIGDPRDNQGQGPLSPLMAAWTEPGCSLRCGLRRAGAFVLRRQGADRAKVLHEARI